MSRSRLGNCSKNCFCVLKRKGKKGVTAPCPRSVLPCQPQEAQTEFLFLSMPSGPGAVAHARARLKSNPPGPRGVMRPPAPAHRAPSSPVSPDRPRLPASPPTASPRAARSVGYRPRQLTTISPGPRVYAVEQPATRLPKVARWTQQVVAAYHNRPEPTSAQDVYAACDLLCSLDPRVTGKRAAHDVNSTGIGVTVSLRDQVIR